MPTGSLKLPELSLYFSQSSLIAAVLRRKEFPREFSNLKTSKIQQLAVHPSKPMDSPLKTPKLKVVRPKSRRNSSKIAIKTSNVKIQDLEDRRLLNWKKWLENREKTCNRLKSLTGRKSEDLLINSYEKIRPKIEIQNLLEAVTESVLPEKSKDAINFWTTPVYLKNRRDPGNPEIAVSLSKKQLKNSRTRSRVFLPELSQKEKLLSIPKPQVLFQTHNEYLRRKLEKFSSELSELNLKTEDIDQVAVEGQKIPDKQRIILKINQKELIFDEDSPKKSHPLRLSLEFSSRKSEKSERSICLSNKTFRTLNYEWQDPVCVRNEFSTPRRRNLFNFAKSSATVPPGCRDELIIWYEPDSQGIHMESIILEISPELPQSPVIVTLWGVCEEPSRFPNRIINYEDYLNTRYRNSVISEVIESIWDRVESPPPESPPYALHFLESEVFSVRNPGFSYHHEVVEELKKMFQVATGRDPWALSLHELQYHILRLDDVNLRSGMLSKLGKLCRGLREPSRWGTLTGSRYHIVYNLVAGFVGKFSGVSENVKSHCRRWSGCQGGQDDLSGCLSWGIGGESQTYGESEGGDNGVIALTGSGNSSLSGAEEYWDTGGDYNEFYHEVFYARIHQLLGDTLEMISAGVDGICRLGEFSHEK